MFLEFTCEIYWKELSCRFLYVCELRTVFLHDYAVLTMFVNTNVFSDEFLATCRKKQLYMNNK